MKFVRMEVEHRRAFAGINVVQCSAKETTRQQAEIATTGDREAKSGKVPGS